MHVKKNDNVKVITGKDKGKTGKIVQAMPKTGKIIIDGVNMHKRHRRATQEGQKGQIIEVAHPIDASNVKKVS